MWGILPDKVYKTCMTDLDDLNHCVRTEQVKLDHAIIAISGEFGGHSRCRMNSGISLLAKKAFFNDVTITSSLRSVVQVLIEHFTIFQSHELSG